MSEMIDGWTAQRIKDFWMTPTSSFNRSDCLSLLSIIDKYEKTIDHQKNVIRSLITELREHHWRNETHVFKDGSICQANRIIAEAQEAIEEGK
jgi:hypothetical protein